MRSIKVSVIVPIYNMEKYIEQCINSIRKQTLQEIEIICVNDGSTDRSEKILERLKSEDERIIIYRQNNLGVAAARNAGIQLAKGEYLSILDADDYFEASMLEKAYMKVVENQADICIFRAKSDYNGRIQNMLWSIRDEWIPRGHIFSPSDVADRLFSITPLWAWDKLYRRNLIQDNKIEFQNLRSTNDAKFVSIAYATAQRICICNDAFAIHRVSRADSLSKTRNKSWKCFYEAMLSIETELRCRGLYELYLQAFRNWVLDFSVWNLNTVGIEVKENVNELIATEILPRYKILEFPKEYYLFSDAYDKAICISNGNYLEVYENIINEMYALCDGIVNESRVVIYGAGEWGRKLVTRIATAKKNIKIYWVDKNWMSYTDGDIPIQNPEDIKNMCYDKIIVAIENKDISKEIVNYLYQLGVDIEQIVYRY